MSLCFPAPISLNKIKTNFIRKRIEFWVFNSSVYYDVAGCVKLQPYEKVSINIENRTVKTLLLPLESSHISCTDASPTVIGIPDSYYPSIIRHLWLISEHPDILSTGSWAVVGETELYTASVQGFKWLDLPTFIIQEINPK